MVTIKLYNFNKRLNSTKKVNVTGVTLECVLLENTSVLNPTVLIEKTESMSAIFSYNYAYIEEFKRYYFINNILTNGSLYTLYLAVDVLGTYRSSIKNSYQYVVRNENSWDDNIVDMAYKTKVIDEPDRTASVTYDSSYVMRAITSGGEPAEGQVAYFTYGGNAPSGSVCFGVIGANGYGANYYVCTEANFITFMSNVFALVPSDMGSLADGVKKMLLDLNQYIVSVIRLPAMPHSSNLGSAVTKVRLGAYDVNCTAYEVRAGIDYEEYWLVNDLALPQHPDINTHDYYAMPPFTTYTLDFLPLGSIPLDAGRLAGQTAINVKWRLDYISGLAWFKVGYYANNTTKWVTLYTDICQVGIPIPLSALKVDNATGFGLSIASSVSSFFKNKGSGASPVLDAVSNSASNFGQSLKDLAGSVSRLISGDKRKLIPASDGNPIGNIATSNTNLFDDVIDYAGSILGDVYTKGSTGSYLNIIAGTPTVRAFFIGQTDEAPALFGKPLYRYVQLMSYTGYTLCQNASVVSFSADGTLAYQPLAEERKAINTLLNSGVILE